MDIAFEPDHDLWLDERLLQVGAASRLAFVEFLITTWQCMNVVERVITVFDYEHLACLHSKNVWDIRAPRLIQGNRRPRCFIWANPARDIDKHILQRSVWIRENLFADGWLVGMHGRTLRVSVHFEFLRLR